MPALKKNQNVVPFKNGHKKRSFQQLPEGVFYPSRDGTPPATAVLTRSAQLLLIHALGQYNGHNNGDIAITIVTMRPFGDLWQSKRHLQDTILELCARGFLVRTRYGRPNLYAFTWIPISEETAHKIESRWIRRDKKGKWIANPLRLFEPRNHDQIDAELIGRFIKMRERKTGKTPEN